MAQEVTINIEFEILKEDSDFTPCDICGELLLGVSNNVYLFLNKKIEDKPVLKLCNSCTCATKHIWHYQ